MQDLHDTSSLFAIYPCNLMDYSSLFSYGCLSPTQELKSPRILWDYYDTLQHPCYFNQRNANKKGSVRITILYLWLCHEYFYFIKYI